MTQLPDLHVAFGSDPVQIAHRETFTQHQLVPPVSQRCILAPERMDCIVKLGPVVMHLVFVEALAVPFPEDVLLSRIGG